jgi:kynurenine formamidase
MPRIIDLSMAIEDHFRWPVERHLKSDHAKGDLFQVTWLGWPVHGFTHMDSPRHFFADGKTTSDIPLETTVGEAAVVDLTPIAPNQEITAERLAAAGVHVRAGDIVVLKSCWEQQRSPTTAKFWTEAPYVSREAATWLLERAPRAVAFDFPQDYTIRLLLNGEVRPVAEHVTHDVLLRNGVILIEYLSNTAALTKPRTFLCCLPLKVPDADGAPARVVALEEHAESWGA